ncbi:MAG: tetratricopeptide repeat protein [Acidobacteriota bacterium]|nr:tetratricopeptide repeat protein [Acidobacteriota bacterium]
MRAGSIAGWIGDSRTVAGAQEFAKNLITEALRIFEEIGGAEKIAEALVEMGICYWHEGAISEARDLFNQAFKIAGGSSSTQEARSLLHIAIMDLIANRLMDAWEVIQRAEPLYERSSSQSARGRFHSTRAIILHRLFEAEGKEEYADRAFVEYTAASVCFEDSGHKRHLARTENNLGFLLFKLHRYKEADEHLERARRIFLELKDTGQVAQVNETRARVFNAQGRYIEAETLAYMAAHVFEQGDDQSLLAGALITRGLALARMKQPMPARRSLERAAVVAEAAGNLNAAGAAHLTLLEELSEIIETRERITIYLRADELLKSCQDADTLRRLRAQAHLTLELVEAQPSILALDDMVTGANLRDEVLNFEAALIRRALLKSNGSVTRAARLLGVTHQRLTNAINTRHKGLLTERTPKRSRFRSIITKPQPKKRK